MKNYSRFALWADWLNPMSQKENLNNSRRNDYLCRTALFFGYDAALLKNGQDVEKLQNRYMREIEIANEDNKFLSGENHWKTHKASVEYKLVCDIATSIWETFYKKDSPIFELEDTTSGVISQISNMVTGLTRCQ